MKILNKNRLDRIPANAVYVGRGSPLGNPYRIGPDGDRSEVIRKYREYIERELRLGDPKILAAFRALRRENDLLCFCAPAACHAEVIREIWMTRFADEGAARPRPHDAADGDIFVFGSNLAGRHGKGAALHARESCGAETGVGEGPTGRAYAIPTKDERLRVLPIESIGLSVRRFLEYAKNHPDLTFRVTRIGCGLAGYADHQIGPLFASAPVNCRLPEEWEEYFRPSLLERPRRLLVCGSRSILDREWIFDRLDRLVSRWSPEQIVLIHGGARGVDQIGGEWARARGIPEETFPAQWVRLDGHGVRERLRGGCKYNAAAGADRNVAMAIAATHGAAFWDGESPGTKHMVDTMDRFGVERRVVMARPGSPSCARPGGFTLIEMLAVLVIAGILAIFMVGRFDDAGIAGHAWKSRVSSLLRGARSLAAHSRCDVLVEGDPGGFRIYAANTPDCRYAGAASLVPVSHPGSTAPWAITPPDPSISPAAVKFLFLPDGSPADLSGTGYGAPVQVDTGAGLVWIEPRTGYVHAP